MKSINFASRCFENLIFCNMLKPKKKIKRRTRASIITRDSDKITAPTGNIYESLSVVSIRARQISNQVKEELGQKIQEFATTVDNLEEIHENREQIEISKYYERMPKPTTLAIEEFLNNELVFGKRTESEDDEII